jgi:hypothetical protein
MSEDKQFKFDVIIGNPPYQEELESTSDKQIFPFFMDEAYKIGKKVELITPAKFLSNAGKTSKKWNEKMLRDPHLKVLYFEQDSSKVFSNTDIKGGVCVTYRDVTKELGPIGTFTPFKELQNIIHKVVFNKNLKFVPISTTIYLQNKFNLDMLYKDYPEIKSKIGSSGKEKRLTTSIFQLPIFVTKKDEDHLIKIWGIVNSNVRNYRFMNEEYLEPSSVLHSYKVLLPKSNGSGALGEVLSTPLIGAPLIGAPLIGYTQSFIGIGKFDDRLEAENEMKYIKSKFCRAMLGTLKVTQDNNKGTWENVPLQDFTNESDIDWTKSIAEIDQQLYKKYNLSEKEINFIETHVKGMN